MSKSKKSNNYLEYIPCINPQISYEKDDDGLVIIQKEWNGFYYRIAQKFFHKPKVSNISLDEYGSFIWQNIDGKRTVFDISKILDAHFPKMEKSLSRLIKFLEILNDHNFIILKENK